MKQEISRSRQPCLHVWYINAHVNAHTCSSVEHDQQRQSQHVDYKHNDCNYFLKRKEHRKKRLLSNTAWHKPISATSTEFYSIQLHTSTPLFILAIYYHWWNRWMSVFSGGFFCKNFARWRVNFTGERSDGQKLTEKRASLTPRFRLKKERRVPCSMSTSLTYWSAEDKRVFFFSETGHL